MTQPPRKRISKPLPGILRCEAKKLEFGGADDVTNVGADALIGPWYAGTNSPECSGNREHYSAGR